MRINQGKLDVAVYNIGVPKDSAPAATEKDFYDRGRDTHYWVPPAQNRTGGIPAYGSHLGCLTAKRSRGHG